MAQHHQPQPHVNTYLASRSQPGSLYAQQPQHPQHSPMMMHQQQPQQQPPPHPQQPTVASTNHHPRPSLSPQPAPLNNAMRTTTSVDHAAIQPPSQQQQQQQQTPPPPAPPATAGFVAPSSQVRSSPLVNDKKPHNLRVQIPNEDSSTSSTASNHGSTTAATSNGMTAAQAATPHMRQGKGASSPTSALPSQFAQNLPSPFSIYPEFLQQNELPSPLNFSATPTTSSAFHWPAASSASSGGQQVMSSARMPTTGDYRPSPLANSHPMTASSHQKRPDPSDAENQRLKKIKLEAAV